MNLLLPVPLLPVPLLAVGLLASTLAMAEQPQDPVCLASPPAPLAALLSIDTPTRTLSFSMDQLQRLDQRSPFRIGLRLAPGVYTPREGGLYIQGAPAGFGSFRVDGIIIDRP